MSRSECHRKGGRGDEEGEGVPRSECQRKGGRGFEEGECGREGEEEATERLQQRGGGIPWGAIFTCKAAYIYIYHICIYIYYMICIIYMYICIYMYIYI